MWQCHSNVSISDLDCTRSEIGIELLLKIPVCSYFTTCKRLNRYQRFEGPQCLQFHGKVVQ